MMFIASLLLGAFLVKMYDVEIGGVVVFAFEIL